MNNRTAQRWRPPAQHSGSNQTRVGIYNERLVLDCIRRHPESASVDICRYTNLSAQTVSGIVNRLLSADLLQKSSCRIAHGAGQPAVPLRLQAQGAYGIGVKIGRTSSETMLVDFCGNVLKSHQQNHPYPKADVVLPWARKRMASYCTALKGGIDRLAGVGVATFFGFGGWREVYPMPEAAVRRWEEVDLANALGTSPHALLVNDATAACIAEYELGTATVSDNLLYIYIGEFVGGGIVLNRQIFFGNNGNAGAIASMPIGRGQLINHASLHLLRSSLAEAGCALGDESPQTQTILAKWRRDAATALAKVVVATVAVLDLKHIIVDGELPATELDALVRAMQGSLTPKRLQGLIRPQIQTGSLGARANCLGAAWLPLNVRYSPAQALLMKHLPAVTVETKR